MCLSSGKRHIDPRGQSHTEAAKAFHPCSPVLNGCSGKPGSDWPHKKITLARWQLIFILPAAASGSVKALACAMYLNVIECGVHARCRNRIWHSYG
jgi:hypothetical protein